MYVTGYDLSLTRSGVAHGGDLIGTAALGIAGVTNLPLAQRYRTISHLSTDLTVLGTNPGMQPGHTPDYRARELPALAMIEAPDTSRAYGGLPERLYLYGKLVERLDAIGIPVATVPSGVLKGYATGNGGSQGGKARLRGPAQELWPEYFPEGRKVTHDEVDALVLAQMGWDWLTGRSRVPAQQRTDWLARPSIQWPAELNAFAEAA